MDLSGFDYYLIVINVIGFIAYIINMLLYRYTEKGQIDILVTIFALVGGSFGIITSVLIFDRKPNKENMMSRVFIVCIFIIELIIFILLKENLLGFEFYGISDSYYEICDFFSRNRILLYYLGIINCVAFVVYAVDKVNACEKRPRIRIITLLGLAFAGGSVGALLAMYLLHHKTQKDYFVVGIPLIIITHMFILYFLIRVGWL